MITTMAHLNRRQVTTHWIAALLLAVLGAFLLRAIAILPAETPGLSRLVKEMMPLSGVRAEVTAVLLNFRGYDTLLELFVLLAALFGVWFANVMYAAPKHRMSGSVMTALVKLLSPVIILASCYLLWLGGHAAGGAFQAGALLSSLGVLLVVTRLETDTVRNRIGLRVLILLGPLMFGIVAYGVTLFGFAFLEYPPTLSGGLILFIEFACTLSIGLILTILFMGGRPVGSRL